MTSGEALRALTMHSQCWAACVSLAEALNRVKKLDLSEHEGPVIISHHVIDPDMAGYAHSIPEHFLQPDALQQRDNSLDFLEKLSTSTEKSVWLIAGDTGSNKENESLVRKNKSPYFMTIVNGLGDKNGDKVLSFSGSNLFYISL